MLFGPNVAELLLSNWNWCDRPLVTWHLLVAWWSTSNYGFGCLLLMSSLLNIFFMFGLQGCLNWSIDTMVTSAEAYNESFYSCALSCSCYTWMICFQRLEIPWLHPPRRSVELSGCCTRSTTTWGPSARGRKISDRFGHSFPWWRLSRVGTPTNFFRPLDSCWYTVWKHCWKRAFQNATSPGLASWQLLVHLSI